jgi:glucose/mannose transport system substrate-binding protein
MRNMLLKLTFSAGVSLAALACGSSSSNDSAPTGAGGSSVTGDGGNQEQTVEIFSWWVAPGEAEALQALFDLNKVAHPNERMLNAAAASGDNARALLAERLAANNPPDLFQENAFNIPAFLQKNPGKLEQLDDLFDKLGLRTAVIPEVISNITVDGKIYTIPVNLHRENTLHYNKQVFAAHNLQPPTTLDEFLKACDALKAAGVTPVVTSDQGWIIRLMFESIAPASMGIAAYRDYFTGANLNHEAELRAAIDVLANILDNYVNASASDPKFGWTEAAQSLYKGEAAMFLHGDWAKGYFVQLGWTPGVDFGVSGAPGASDLFLYGVDTFAMPTGAPHPAGARDFLGTVASTAGQVAFNRLKGSSPMRLDVPKDQLDLLGQATLADLELAKIRMYARSINAWDDAFAAFTTSKDKDALYKVFADNPPTPQ